jgi:hypothetical protein
MKIYLRIEDEKNPFNFEYGISGPCCISVFSTFYKKAHLSLLREEENSYR